ncbi:VOC family protein [Stenotrophomonas sp. SY1]|uniref:VOC family protein n=1 Tax=Stenotrophomonas sp. SY1 TaxID=477235 RepID=UPI001E4A2714|nr:VOC family protein [Stenotrophomonas sp. SY1]MCD9086348.1 VOC family protein [Stenotrophomonas sp. SY1]
MDLAAHTTATVIPCLRYRDAPAAIDWLCNAFGFQRQAVYQEGDIVQHAQLVFGNGMLMLSSVQPSAWGTNMIQPDEVGGMETQSACVIISDADAHYARAKAAGAEILIDIADQEYGGRGYGCRDIEGHIWWFGTYDPWKDTATA